MPGVLFVCLGNICRSPLVEGYFVSYFAQNHLAPTFFADSAATSTYHVGEHPHSGGQKCAKGHGIDISKHRSRQVKAADFDNFDLIIGMDYSNMEDLEYMKKSLNPKGKAELKMLADFIPGQHGKEVPDAYYARDQRACFEEIYQMAADSASELVSYLQNKQYTCLLKTTLSIRENARKVLSLLPPTAYIYRIRTL